MTSLAESPNMLKMSEPLVEFARHLEPLFPHMEWDLKRSDYTIDSAQYLAVTLYVTLTVFFLCAAALVAPVAFVKGWEESYSVVLVTIGVTGIMFVYMLIVPKVKMSSRARIIDRDLEYMLKDMQIQLTSGVPLFDTLVNIARGEYGECSKICEDIIHKVEQGNSITEVLDEMGLLSPSEYLRKTLWQIVNALKSGSDVAKALEAISTDIRLEKENKIKAYGKELNLHGLIYMMLAVIIPSMGVTLLVILSSFIGGGVINESLFWVIMAALLMFQALFISFVKNKRPNI
ncbi:MAG: hypothetical protein GF416_00365 [Candidatus Altiarchaeales archaeon]|nr:hypothetical protein [Candidatus Altiarchaeales archaeon]MBD3415573.1 hypothetical protein [Candidatus Altiarchaeales archaeon]